ncbi:MAG: GNAT family N-acetyltransferase [Hyphomicrobiaceae bacterium]|nr:GNAT family N-acetyltransferase [Hyphomicrobiaceae bacterium]
MHNIDVVMATQADLPAFKALLRCFAEERGELHQMDEAHASAHLSERLAYGMSFLARKAGEPIGTIMCRPLDLGFRMGSDIETDYTYVIESERKLPVITALLNAAESFADSRGATLIMHQLDYLAAVAGSKSNGDRVEKLYRRRRYVAGNVVYARQPYVRVGLTYLYTGATSQAVQGMKLPGVRLIREKAIQS